MPNKQETGPSITLSASLCVGAQGEGDLTEKKPRHMCFSPSSPFSPSYLVQMNNLQIYGVSYQNEKCQEWSKELGFGAELGEMVLTCPGHLPGNSWYMAASLPCGRQPPPAPFTYLWSSVITCSPDPTVFEITSIPPGSLRWLQAWQTGRFPSLPAVRWLRVEVSRNIFKSGSSAWVHGETSPGWHLPR